MATQIEALFEDWKHVRARNDEAAFPTYSDLQERITALHPQTARDMAIQLVVETDFGESDYRDDFFARVAILADPMSTNVNMGEA